MFSEKRSGLVFNAMDVYIQISNNAIYYFRAAVFEPASYADYSSIIQEMLNSLNFSAQ
jgi:rRNA pseudouridine-1189 N-methylase Emg1 (Nep1/Mra1 family)